MRNSLPHSRIMIHQPSGGARGQASDVLIQAEEIINLKKQINLLYAKHTGKPVEVIAEHVERDHYMSPTAALQFGLIDNVLGKQDEVTPSVDVLGMSSKLSLQPIK